MKKIPLNEMQRIQGGVSLQFMCYGLGILTVVSLAQPATTFSLYYAAPAIKYCWNN